MPNPGNPNPPDCPRRSSLTAMTSPACSSFLLTGFDDCSLIGLSFGLHPRVPAAHRVHRRLPLQCRLRVPGGALGHAALQCADGLTASPQRPPQRTGLPALRPLAAGCPFGQRRGGFGLFSGHGRAVRAVRLRTKRSMDSRVLVSSRANAKGHVAFVVRRFVCSCPDCGRCPLPSPCRRACCAPVGCLEPSGLCGTIA